MIDFKISEEKCIKCGECAEDCPVNIIDMPEDGFPFIKNTNEKKCMMCQHCLAVCPTAALSILGVDPDSCVKTEDIPDPSQVDALIRNRRTVRRYKQKNVAPEQLETLFKTAANAPTGKNTRTVHLSVIDDINEMKKFSDKVISIIEEMDSRGELTEPWEFFRSIARAYRSGNDIVFRGAPHLVIASLPEDAPTPDADGIITLSYLELMAASMGLGTVWLGFLMYILQLAPQVKELLNIPEKHNISYAMLLGEPSVKYHRGVQRDEIGISKINFDD